MVVEIGQPEGERLGIERKREQENPEGRVPAVEQQGREGSFVVRLFHLRAARGSCRGNDSS